MSSPIVAKLIDSLNLDEGQTYRGDCPGCLCKNTFTVSRIMYSILYKCYKNTCRLSGVENTSMEVSTIEDILANGITHQSEQELFTFAIPPYLVPYPDVQNPIYPAFLRRYDIDPQDVFYDIRQDRLVFLVVHKNGELVDAVGRSLNGRKPKWLRYASSPVPYVHGHNSDTVVIVEDAISAYVIGTLYPHKCVCLALLGTNLTPFHKQYIKKYYDNVIVALDPDALIKAIDIANELNGKVLGLMDDLKYKLSEDLQALEEMLNA